MWFITYIKGKCMTTITQILGEEKWKYIVQGFYTIPEVIYYDLKLSRDRLKVYAINS